MRNQAIRHVLVRAALLGALNVCWSNHPAAQGADSIARGASARPSPRSLKLEAGGSVRQALEPGQAHNYVVSLAAGQFLSVVVEQLGANVKVSAFGPREEKLAWADDWITPHGKETLYLVAQLPGPHRIQVQASNETLPSGQYEIRIVELRPATEADRSRVEAQSLFSGAKTLRQTGGSLTMASEKLDRVLLLWQSLGDRNREADTLEEIGNTVWDRGERSEAIKRYEQVLSLRVLIGEPFEEACILNNLGRAHQAMGQPLQALEYYNRAFPFFQDTGFLYEKAVVLSNLAGVESQAGQIQRAIDRLNEALSIHRSLGCRSGEAAALTNLGGIHGDMGELEKAAEHFTDALRVFRETGARANERTVLSNLGEAHSRLGHVREAVEYYEQALGLSRTPDDQWEDARVLLDMGMLFQNSGDTVKAAECYRRASRLPLAEALGLLRQDQNRRASATGTDLSKALELLDRVLTTSKSAGDLLTTVIIHDLIASVEASTGNLQRALAHSSAALSIVESVRSSIASPDLRASYLGSSRGHYDQYVEILMRLHGERPTEGHDRAALETTERARSRSFLELLNEARVDIRGGVPEELLEQERRLGVRLNAKASEQMRLAGGSHASDETARVAKEVADAAAEYQSAQEAIRQHSPRYAALAQPVTLTASEIQTQLLDADSVLLVYWLGKDRSFLWTVTPTSLATYELPARETIESAARRVYGLLTVGEGDQGQKKRRRKPSRDAVDDYWREASALSRMLLAPAERELTNKRLLVIAEGALQYVPFAALPEPGQSARGFGGPQGPPLRLLGQTPSQKAEGAEEKSRSRSIPLIANHEVVNLPSLSALAVLRGEMARRAPASRTVAVFADPVFSAKDLRVRRGSVAGGSDAASKSFSSELERASRGVGLWRPGGTLPRLPFTRRESKAIVTAAGTEQAKAALDFQASRAAALGQDLAKYRILHFATHGFVNGEHPELSGLVLSLVDERGKLQDGFLRLHEVYNLKLSADLVVLSACQTALGKEIRSEGMIGLARGFMYAGSPRVVASLWRVDDASTAALMKRFYVAMLGPERLSAAAALRSAQRSLYKSPLWENPYFWAGFTLQGEWR